MQGATEATQLLVFSRVKVFPAKQTLVGKTVICLGIERLIVQKSAFDIGEGKVIAHHAKALITHRIKNHQSWLI